MYYLLHDPDDYDAPFEMVNETSTDCVTYQWFRMSPNSSVYATPDSVPLRISEWIVCLDSNAYILHQFATKPTKLQITDYITQNHPELLL